ncbi:CARDB domain-containing protein, partial [Algoriphagus taiwanensis]|uniref:CARDB domain-containing protein n=1 Tax=Algoriphagus taiwanensis TaxID=1445656 RepID=UPI0030C748A8
MESILRLRFRKRVAQVFSLFDFGNGFFNGRKSWMVIFLLLIQTVAYAQAPTVPASNLRLTDIDGDRFIARYTRGDGQNRIIIASESPITAVPVDGADYLAGNYGLGNEISPGQYVVYKGTASDTYLYGFNHSTTYYIRIYEYNGSNFTTQYLKDQFVEGTVTTLTGPTVQASNLTFSNVTGNAMTLNWTRGDGSSRMIVARVYAPVDAEPVDLTSYGSSASFGNGVQISPGNYVIYNGSGTSMNLSNLSPNKTYHFSIFEFNGSNGRIYLRPGATGSQLTASAPTVPASNFSTRSVDGNRFIYDFTRGNGTRRIVIAKKGSPVTAVPEDGQTYSSSETFGSGTEIGPGEFVVYNGTANAVFIYGLEPATTYHFAVFEYNGTGSETFYLRDPYLVGTGTTLTGPTVQASNLTFSNVTGNAMTLNWTSGDGSSRMIVAREGAPVDAEPVDLTGYGASASFGSGNQISPGNYVIYNGSGTSMNLSNLSPNKTYHFSIFEYNGSAGRIYLRPGATGSQLTASGPTTPASNFSTRSVDGNRFIYDFTQGNGTRRMVIAKKGSPVTAVPEDGQTYSSSETFGSGTEIAPGEFVVHNGTANGAWLYGLEPGTTYHFAVFEYNGTGSEIFYLRDPYLAGTGATLSGPTVQASNLTFSNVTGNSMRLNWTRGDGSSRMIVARVDAPVDAEPVDLTGYGSSSSFGGGNQISPGNYVIYNGGGTSMDLTNLSPNKTYHFSIFEYNGSSGRIYLRPGATGSQLTESAPTTPASNFFIRNVDGDRFIYEFTRGNGTRRMVIAKKGSPVTAVPVDGQTYSSSETFGSGPEIAPGEFVVYNGTANAVFIYGLEPATTYHFAVFEYNGTGSEIYYQTDPYLAGTGSTLSTPTVQSSNAFISSRSNNSINISWTRGDGAQRILIGRKDGPVNIEPQDFTNYSTSTTFGTSSTQIGTGNYALAVGNGNNVNITNLEPGTNYNFALFEFNGSNAKLYLRPGYAFSLATFGERPTVQSSNASYSNIGFNSIDVSFVKGNGTRRLVLARAGSAVNAGPSDFAAYAASSTFGQGDEIGSGNFVVFNGLEENFSLEGLEPGVTYHLAFFEYTVSAQGELYLAPAYTSTQGTLESYDLALSAVLSPESSCVLTETENITVEVTNLSSTPVEAFSLGYSINGASPVIEEVAGENLIAGNGTFTYTFNQSFDFSLDGIYDLRAFLVLDGDVNSENDELTVAVENFPEPEVSITGNTTIVAGESLVLEATGGVEYLWSTGETTASIAVQPLETTVYSVVITDQNGCTVELSVQVEVLPDPCAEVTCPPGTSCFEGACFTNIVELSGVVRDADTNAPLENVKISGGAADVFTGSNGFYSMQVNALTELTFEKSGYVPQTISVQESAGTQVLDVNMLDLCSGVTCPEGYDCFGGACFPRPLTLSGFVKQAGTQAVIAGAMVSTQFETVQTDENGFYTIQVTTGDVVVFSKDGYLDFETEAIVVDNLDFNVELQVDPCFALNCPEGFTCFNQQCIPEILTVTGTVRDLDTNEPLAGAKITLVGECTLCQFDWTQDVFTDSEGNFSVPLSYESSLNFSKPGYLNASFGPVTADVTDAVILMEGDPQCALLECPPGTQCYLGSCIPISYEVSGTVRDSETNEPIAGVLVSSLGAFVQGDIFTDSEGNFSIGVEYNSQIEFSKSGYLTASFGPIRGEVSDAVILMEVNDPQCVDNSCPIGTVCNLGICSPITYEVSGQVINQVTLEPVVGVLVDSPDKFLPGDVFTDSNGNYSILVEFGARITFSKTGYESYTTIGIIEDTPDLLITLKGTCDGVFCNIGQQCYEGECYIACAADLDCPPGTRCAGNVCLPNETDVPFETIIVSGVVRDADSNLPIAGARVFGALEGYYQKEIFTASDGSYEIVLNEGASITYSKTGYESQSIGPLVVGDSVFDVNLVYNPCRDVYCQIGQVCVSGECKIACAADQDCPPGTFCMGGACISAEELCLVTDCPPGTVCLNGRCITEEDPCFNSSCPAGSYCVDGTCYESDSPFVTIEGVVRDAKTGSGLGDADIIVGENYKSFISQRGGIFSVQVPIGMGVEFTKWDYTSTTIPPVTGPQSGLEIELYKNWCLIHSCQPGQVCINGRCETIFYTLSGTVRDESTNEPLSGVTVTTAAAEVLTDENGNYSIQVILGNVVVFLKDGYKNFQTDAIEADNESFDVNLTPGNCTADSCEPGFVCENGECVPDLCAEANCPPGEFCFNGFCFPQGDLTIFGTVKDIVTGEPIAASAVVDGKPTLVDYNGFFIVQVPYGEQILFIADGYEWEYSPFLTEDYQVLEILMTPVSNCENVSCPEGTICDNGVCKDPCELVTCPPGQACFGGQCFPAACESTLTDLQVTPEVGDSETEFTFTISYRDPANVKPAAGYPRLQLAYESPVLGQPGLNIFFEMTEVDPNDRDVRDGKLYQVTVSGLYENSGLTSYVIVQNEAACIVATPEFSIPRVADNNLDLAIFANNISFSTDNPLENESVTLFARIRNLSDFPAENFVVSAYDGETQIFSTTVDLLEAGRNQDFSWTYSFGEAGFYPIKVVIDETNQVEEINELNNFAIRPILVGNFVLPGGIEASASPNTTTVYVGNSITVSGSAQYFGIEEGVNPNVVGANVSISFEGGSTQTTTDTNGNFRRSIKMPSVPGIYTFTGTVTDYTLSADLPSFQVEVIPYPEKPDLKTDLVLDQAEIFLGEEVSGTATVTNIGELTAVNFTLRIQSCEGLIQDILIPSLAPGESLSYNFITIISDTIGSCLAKNNCSITAIADATNQVDDKTRVNNTVGRSFTVYPELPDLTAVNSLISSSSRMVDPFNFTVRVDNIGGVAVSQPFTVNVYLDDVLVDSRQFEGLGKCSQISYPLSIELESGTDQTIRVKVDEPLGSGQIIEYKEDNNEFVRLVRYLPPPTEIPNLYITNTFLSVDPALPEAGQNFVIQAKVRNIGNAPVEQDFEVNFRIEENGEFRNERVTISGGLVPGGEKVAQLATSLAQFGNNGLLVEIDPDNLIEESTKFDNKASMPLCVDLVAVKSGSIWGSTFFVDTKQNLTGRVRNTGLFTAYNVRVDFLLNGAEIGNVIIPELKPSFGSQGQWVTLPYVFRNTGVFQLELAVDRNEAYVECNEINNSASGEIRVRDQQPDLRILSEYITPSELNPEPGEEVNLFVSFENIGVADAQPFKVRVTVDDVPLGADIPVNGLAAGQLSTVPVTVPYSSPTAGIKVVRGIIDVDRESDDVSYANNEATRALVVGRAPNLFFTKIDFSTYCPNVGDQVEIFVDIENEGDLVADAEVYFYYLTETDTIPIDFVPISVDLLSSTSASINWTVVNPDYRILAEIKNSDPQEFDDLDNRIFGEFVDINPPVVKVKGITVYLDEDGEASILPEDIDDGSFDQECGIASLTLDRNVFECSLVGSPTLVRLTALDFAGNEASAEAEVLVLDEILPTITAPTSITVSTDSGLCEASGVDLGTPETGDNCSVASVSNDAPAVFPLGETLVTWTVIDASGNIETATQLVTVKDTEKPTITAPGAITVSTDAGLCEASGVDLGTPETADNCSVASVSNDAPA